MKRKFSDSMVQQIVKEYLECRSPKYIFKKYGMSKSSLYYWARVMRQVKRPTAPPVSFWEIHKMERQLKILQEENQIFKVTKAHDMKSPWGTSVRGYRGIKLRQD